ncbi:hypothetical protein LVD17_08470 [Fulvivirga ulvae]|nr:hypothetical protein [Fulvivirga ulvae]UII33847.1 hypothetical protein LVD17_08470 [Fulvivirga ulvae]
MSDKNKKEVKQKEEAKGDKKDREPEFEEEKEHRGVLPDRNLKKNLGCGG